jgi:hypothetical protein
MGHAATVLAGEPGAKIPRTDQINGVQVIRWPTQVPDNTYHMPLAADKLREVAIRLAKEADVLHVHNIHAVLPIYVLNATSNLQIRKVVTPYYHGTGHTPIRKLLWTYWRRHIYRLITTTDAAHTVSKSEAQLIRQDFGRHAPALALLAAGAAALALKPYRTWAAAQLYLIVATIKNLRGKELIWEKVDK